MLSAVNSEGRRPPCAASATLPMLTAGTYRILAVSISLVGADCAQAEPSRWTCAPLEAPGEGAFDDFHGGQRAQRGEIVTLPDVCGRVPRSGSHSRREVEDAIDLDLGK